MGILSDDCLEKITVYVNDKDVVPRLSLGSVAKLLAMLREVDSVGLSTDEQFGVVMWREDSVMSRERVIRAVKEVRQDRFLYLQHPAQVIHLVNRGNTVEVKVEGEEEAKEDEVFWIFFSLFFDLLLLWLKVLLPNMSNSSRLFVSIKSPPFKTSMSPSVIHTSFLLRPPSS